MSNRKPIDRRPKCRTCGDRFVPINGNLNQKHCLEKDPCVKAHLKLSKQKQEKARQQQRRIEKIQIQQKKIVLHSESYASKLASGCQKLARLIDHKFGYDCIDCDKPFRKQVDGGHFHSKGNNATIKYNLHNIHSQRSNCNRNGHGSGRKYEYLQGLVKRYGKEYAKYIEEDLPKQFKYIGLKEHEIYEKLRVVNSLIRNFDTLVLHNAIEAREILNLSIGIYGKSVYSSCETIKNDV